MIVYKGYKTFDTDLQEYVVWDQKTKNYKAVQENAFWDPSTLTWKTALNSEKKLKIYLSGAHGSGKSTLARHIAKTQNLPMIPECARMILSEQELQIDRLRSDIDAADQYQQDVFFRQIEEEKKFESFVSDRSAIDNLAYTASHSRLLSKFLNSAELDQYVEGLKDPNAFIFFIRPSKATLRADGVREHLSWDGVVAIDAQIKLLFEMFDLRYFSVSMESAQERIRLIESVLSLNPH